MSIGDRRTGRSSVVRHALRNPRLRRALVAFFLFNVSEWANWIALLVWGYSVDGVRGASLIALVQLVPSALLAPVVASLLGRLSLGRALVVGYAAQASANLALGVALVLDAPLAVCGLLAVVSAVAVTTTRPVHNAFLPEISRTTGDLTAGNAASGSVEAAATFLGPLLSGAVVGVWQPGVVLLASGGFGVLSVLVTWQAGSAQPRVLVVPGREVARPSARMVLQDPAARALCVLVAAENALVGMMDILLVVLALDLLAMSDAGPGILNSAIGAGGLAGAAFTFVLIGRQRLAPALLIGAVVAGGSFAAAGLVSSVVPALALVALCGCGKLFFDVASRTFLQRALPDRMLAAVFATQESMMMAGMALGTLVAPLLTTFVGARSAFLVAGLLLPVVALAFTPRLRRIDAGTVVPEDVLRLLLGVPILAVLPPRILERVARDAVPVRGSAERPVITEGEPGSRFFVIASGRAEVSHGDDVVRELGPGDWFGELALLRDGVRTATVTARDDLELWAVERESFLLAVQGTPRSVEVADEHAQDRYR